jgi:hypothetical protein
MSNGTTDGSRRPQERSGFQFLNDANPSMRQAGYTQRFGQSRRVGWILEGYFDHEASN